MPGRTAYGKVLPHTAFNIAKSPKYDGYQRGLTSMVYTFFDKASCGSGVKSVNVMVTTQEFTTLTTDDFAQRLKQAKLTTKDDIADFVKKIYFNEKLKY